MPFAIDPSDRKLLRVAGALFIVLAAGIAYLGPTTQQQANPVPSLYATDSGGARAAYVLLKELHYPVKVWERPPTELPKNPERAVLILADPIESPLEKEKTAVMDFVNAGGRVLFTGPRLNSFSAESHVSEEPLESWWENFDANLPGNFTAGAPTISLQRESNWTTIQPSQVPLYGPADSAVVVSWRLGRGEIIWWASASPLTNAGISREDNLNLFLDSVSSETGGASDQPVIYWDEYFHGQRDSLWDYVQGTPVAWGVLQVAILGVAVLITFSRRSGPVVMPAPTSRLWPLEFVDTIGGLYERAHAEPAVVGAVYQRFRSLLTRHLRLPLNTPDEVLANAIRVRLGWKDAALADTLRRAAVASRALNVPPDDALEIIHRLESLEDHLGMKRKK